MAGPDRFSLLPPEVIVSILSRLPLKDAVRTSVLARSWHHLWTFRSRLSLGWPGDPLGNTGNSGPVASSWIERVHHVVSSLRGPLLHFALCEHFSYDQSALLQRLLDLLLQKEGCLDTLHLSIISDSLVIHLPSFHSLKRLALSECRIVLPTGFQGFQRLSTLSLQSVQISNDDLNFLIHTSNNLTGFQGINFVASEDHPLSVKLSLPLLRYLEFGINNSVEKVEVISAPCLEQASILNYTYSDSEKFASVTLGFLTTAVMVSSLELSFNVLKLGDHSIDANRNGILMRELLLKKHDGVSCLDQTLECVRIDTENLNHFMTGMTLVKFFLLNARVLKLMKVAYRTGSGVEPRMIEELQKAKVTTSPEAEVVMICQRENVIVNF
ncbi:hypothetical protein LUZ61_007829 [Rhynchospora tenuis]|uniref:F-box domain-containing protein n=1 Tax=Rhynchospora tenuis TaxID=198213 RepID=A0AAD5ZUD0_9POAL|nr:hypothetical protein LUZ61_007828 [Rhynchospora tenuis]KAJ3704124.1 hypothetical protein LUZ61_007829 [Rhynchospora tenuis]